MHLIMILIALGDYFQTHWVMERIATILKKNFNAFKKQLFVICFFLNFFSSKFFRDFKNSKFCNNCEILCFSSFFPAKKKCDVRWWNLDLTIWQHTIQLNKRLNAFRITNYLNGIQYFAIWLLQVSLSLHAETSKLLIIEISFERFAQKNFVLDSRI